MTRDFNCGPTHSLSPWSRDFLVLDFFGFLCCPSGFSTVFFYYLLVLYRAVTQNVQPARTFLLYTYMTCGLLARERARRRASARAERAIKKNWHDKFSQDSAHGQNHVPARAVCSGVTRYIGSFFLEPEKWFSWGTKNTFLHKTTYIMYGSTWSMTHLNQWTGTTKKTRVKKFQDFARWWITSQTATLCHAGPIYNSHFF